MLDPENLDFKDDESKKRRLALFKGIMVSIGLTYREKAWTCGAAGLCPPPSAICLLA
jgi:hypothetical protein